MSRIYSRHCAMCGRDSLVLESSVVTGKGRRAEHHAHSADNDVFIGWHVDGMYVEGMQTVGIDEAVNFVATGELPKRKRTRKEQR